MTLPRQHGAHPPSGESNRQPEGTYRASPRPTFDRPTLITKQSAVRHVWGDPESGEVADRIYVSSQLVHALVWELPPHGSFRHSPHHRTVFGADEFLYVLQGVMAIANPETGEVHRLEAGESVFFRKDTWHHAFAHGDGPLSVLELFAPPPSAGASGAYARMQPYLNGSKYAKDELLGQLVSGGPGAHTLRRLSARDIVWRRDLGVLVGLYASTEHLTVGSIEVDCGQRAASHEHGGDEILYVTEGRLLVRAWQSDDVSVLEAGPDDACYLPAGCRHEYLNFGGTTARAIFGVAPAYLG